MSNMDPQVKQATALFKAGRKEEAKAILMDVVDKDEQNEQAWLWLSAMVDSLEEQQICLENVVHINPANERARKGLDSVNEKIAAQNNSGGFPPAPSEPAAPPPSARSSKPIGAEFETASGDNPFGTPPQSQGGGFDSWMGGSSTDSFASPTSVDWSQPNAPAAPGSGKNVELPSAQEYDSWLQNLNLGATVPPAQPPSNSQPSSFGPFGDTSFMVDSGPFGGADNPPAAQAEDNPFGDIGEPSPWENENPFEEPTSQTFGSPSAAPAFGGVDSFADDIRTKTNQSFGSPFGSFGVSQPAAQEEEELRFDFDDDSDEEDEEFDAVFGSTESKASGYFQYIPAEIEAASSGRSLGGLATTGGVIILLLLNLAAVAALVMGLMG